jgi:hypothetical protein
MPIETQKKKINHDYYNHFPAQNNTNPYQFHKREINVPL